MTTMSMDGQHKEMGWISTRLAAFTIKNMGQINLEDRAANHPRETLQADV